MPHARRAPLPAGRQARTIDIKHHVHFQTEVLTIHGQGVLMPDPHERLKKHMYVYRLNDLKILEDEMEQFWEAALYFNAYLRESDNKTKFNHWTRIHNFPIFKAALENQ